MNVEPPETLVLIESIVYKSNGFAIGTGYRNSFSQSPASRQSSTVFMGTRVPITTGVPLKFRGRYER
jgi:hypothetical protein